MILSPKEKAKELYSKFEDSITGLEGYEWWESAKQCALIAVDEILKSKPLYPNEVDWDDCGATHIHYHNAQREEADKFWQEVKKEIELL